MILYLNVKYDSLPEPSIPMYCITILGGAVLYQTVSVVLVLISVFIRLCSGLLMSTLRPEEKLLSCPDLGDLSCLSWISRELHSFHKKLKKELKTHGRNGFMALKNPSWVKSIHYNSKGVRGIKRSIYSFYLQVILCCSSQL